MKLIRSTPEGYAWSLSPEEWQLLRLVLGLFPLTPTDHLRLSKSIEAKASPLDESWLQESLSAHVAELRSTLDALVQSGRTADRHRSQGICLNVPAADLEKLLQILNDIRVGSWIQLGCPSQEELAEREPASPRFLFAMEFSGWVQGHILKALSNSDDLAAE